MSDEIQQSVRTRELRLVDNNGVDRALLSAQEDGNVYLSFLDGSDQARLRIGINAQGTAVIELGRGVDAPNLSITVDKDGRVVSTGVDNTGVERVKLDMKPNGSHTELSFSEKNRKPRMIIIAEDKGPAGIFILDPYGKALFSTTP